MSPLLAARGLVKEYRHTRTHLLRPAPRTRAVDDVSLEVAAGESAALIGESGSGKSTLVRLLLALSRADAGTIELDGRPVAPGSARSLRWLRRRTGIVLQDPYASLDPRRTVEQSVAEPLVALDVPGRHDRAVREVLDRVGLPSQVLTDYPRELSGGQRQRVAIARAVVHGPDLLIGDEPLSALDVSVRAQVLDLLRDLHAQTGMALLLVSHDLGLVQHLADTVHVMHGGRVVERGPTSQVLAAPAHPYTRTLIESVPRMPAPAPT